MTHPLLMQPGLLALLFDDSPLCALVLDAAGRVAYGNASLARRGGWATATLRGQDGRRCVGADPETQRWLAAWLAGDGHGRTIDGVLADAAGRRCAVQWCATPLRDAAGAIAGLALVGFPADAAGSVPVRARRLADFYRSLADTNQAIVALKEPQALYDAICRIAVESGRAAMAWIGVVDGDRLRPVAWGGAAAAYTAGIDLRVAAPGVPPGPSVLALRSGRHQVCNDFLHDPRTAPWRDFAAGFGIHASGAFPFRRGGVVSGTLNLYFDQADAFDPPLIALLDEMTNDLSFALDNVDREAARVQAEQALREREQQLSEIIDTAMDAIITVDAGHRIVVFNRAAERIFGLAREQAIGQGVDRFVPAPHRAGHRAQMAAFAAPGGSSRAMGRPRELTGLRADGTPFPMEASISRVGEGDRVLMTVMARDVTQLRQAEQAQLARTVAEAANRAKTAFLSRISHELRTPLNAVLGFARLMRDDRDAPLAGQQQARIDLVLQAGSHLHTLIDEMLDVARIEAGRMSLEATDFDLGELLDGVLRMSEPHAQACGVMLQAAHADAGPLPMRSDAARLRQVLLNLVSNAIKYNRGGGWVRVAVHRQGGAIQVDVEDNGMGMTEAQRAGLFQPFNRLGRELGPVPGMGIGLALVRQLLRLLGGELAIDSREGEGTTAHVRLPAGGIPALAPAAPPAGAQPPPGQQPAPHGVVLYIEDNPVNMILVQQLLSRWPGVRLVEAADGASGLQRARTLQPDVVLLDMQLPDIDGIEVLRRLRADPATAGLAVVALSASAVAQDVQAALDAGALAYWTKPIDFDLFASGMQRLLGARPGAA